MEFSDHVAEKKRTQRPSTYQYAPDIKFDRKSTYKANYTAKPINVDRKCQPHKSFTVPSQQMEKQSLYQDTFTGPKNTERTQQYVPKGEYQPPNDHYVKISEHADELRAKPIDVDRKYQPHKPFSVPTQEMEKQSLYQDTYVQKNMKRTEPYVPKGEYQPPNDQRDMISEHTAEFRQKQANLDRKYQPSKAFSIPTERMETQTLYQDTFVKKEMDRVRPFAPKGEYQPPHDQREMKSEHAAEFQEKLIDVDRKYQPHKTFKVPTVQMATESLYQGTYVPKHIDRVHPFSPKGEYQPPNYQREMISEQHAEFNAKPINLERHGRPHKPYSIPELKMEVHSTYHAGFADRKPSERAELHLPKSNSWYKMTNEGHQGTEHNREYQPISVDAMKDAKLPPFLPKNRPLGNEDAVSRRTEHRASFVHPGTRERAESNRTPRLQNTAKWGIFSPGNSHPGGHSPSETLPVGYNIINPAHFQTPDGLTNRRGIPGHIRTPPYVGKMHVPLPQPQTPLTDPSRIAGVRRACILARHTLNFVGRHVKEGITTADLDDLAFDFIIGHNAYPSPLMYKGYPKSICTCVNNVACHGIPDTRPLQNGDILNIDVTVYTGGYHGDCSATFGVGTIDDDARLLIDTTALAVRQAIRICRHGVKFSEIGKTIDGIAEEFGYSVVPDFCGHGIGSDFHMRPSIVHVSPDKLHGVDNSVMETGMIFTIEPILSEGSAAIKILPDGWTAVSVDDSRSAQHEETILITEDGAEVLTVE
ncbi:Methionine aminopeptidase 1D, mitochondrial [Hypsibius exemplaris]|uniref:Methionine aminopeptidase n=1 Tax=Hypsibius exemplaris TaxID=2072580 RepID=A0A1W0WF09_HYPEX|nr:Methionine aminopeptidase 1D, mitochondrial [Hypsibius exemplaris]